MILVNADDFGRSRAESEAAVSCYTAGRLTSSSAMVFMRDSARAAGLALELGMNVGLHLNLSQPFSGPDVGRSLRQSHDRVVRFLGASKYALLVYNPFIRRQFRDVVDAQLQEFVRLYGGPPSHIDGHQHQHLCSNVLIDGLIPATPRVRRSFSFSRGEKSVFNRAYRNLVDRTLAQNYGVTDFFFSLAQCLATNRLDRVLRLAQTATVELMTHPANGVEYDYLMSDEFLAVLRRVGCHTARGAN